MNIPETLPTLHGGSHEPGSRELCAMEAAAWLAAEPHSDKPSCVHPALAAMARSVNDNIADVHRQKMWPLIIRCLGTNRDDKDLSVQLSIWCAQQVLSNYETQCPGDLRPRQAIDAALAWVNNPCEETRSAAGSARSAAESAAWSAASAGSAAWSAGSARSAAESAAWSAESAAWSAAESAAGSAASAAWSAGSARSAAWSAGSAERQLSLLTGLLDEYDRLTGRTECGSPSDDAWDRVLVAGGMSSR